MRCFFDVAITVEVHDTCSYCFLSPCLSTAELFVTI